MGISRKPITNIEATKAQIEYLGFQPGHEIWLQLSYNCETNLCPDWPTFTDKNSNTQFRVRVFKGIVTEDFGFRVQECQSTGNGHWKPEGPKFEFNDIEALALQGANVFLYPNKPKGGIKNINVNGSNVIFFEIDDRTIDEQWSVIDQIANELGLFPSCVVFSGGKSLQTYYQLDEKLPEKQRLLLIRQLTCIAQSDPMVCNAARAMRLAGMPRARLKNGYIEWHNSTVELITDEIYSADEIVQFFEETELFPFGLSDRRWREYVKLQNAGGEGVEALEKEFRTTELNKQDTSEINGIFNAQELKDILNEAAPLMKNRVPGEGTYQSYRGLAVGICNLLGESFAEQWMRTHCGTAQDWTSTIQSSDGKFNIFSILNGLEACSRGWKRSPFVNTRIRNYFQKKQTQKILGSLSESIDDTIFFCLTSEQEQLLKAANLTPILVPSYWSLFPKMKSGDRVYSDVVENLVQKNIRQYVFVGKYLEDPREQDYHVGSIALCRKLLAGVGIDCAVLPADKIKEETLPALISAKKWCDENRKDAHKRQYKKLITLEVNKTVNEQYINPEHYLSGDFLGVIGACGTGKSTARHNTNANTNGHYIIVSGQNALLKEGCSATSIINVETAIDHHTDLAYIERDRPFRGAFSVAALPKLEHVTIAPGSTLELDEVEAVCQMLATGATLGNRQALANKILKRLIQETLESGGRVIFSQNRITPATLDFLSELAGRRPTIIRNEYQHQGRTVRVHTGGSLGGFAQHIINAAKEGDRIAVPTMSQIGGAVLEKLLIENGITDILRLDKTTKDQHSKLFINPDQYLQAHQPQIFIYSPVMGFGVNYHAEQLGFDRIMGFAHCQNVESIIQSFERDRDRMDCDIYTVPAIPTEKFRSIWPDEIGRRYQTNANSTIKKLGLKLELNQASERGLSEEIQANIERLEMLGEMCSDTGLNAAIVSAKTRYEAIANYEQSNLCRALIEALEGQGDTVEVIKLERNSTLTQRWAMAKALTEFESAQFWAAQSMLKYKKIEVMKSRPEAVAEAIADSGSSSRTYSEHVAALKYLAAHKFPDCPMDDPTFILKAFIERNGEFSNQVFRYFLIQNPDVARQLDEQNLSRQFKSGLVLSTKFSNLAEFVQLHQYLGTLKVLELETFDNESAELMEWVEKAQSVRPQFERITGYHITQEKTPVRLFNPIARSLAFDPERKCGRGSRGAEINVYGMGHGACRQVLMQSLKKRYLIDKVNFKVGQAVRFWHTTLNQWFSGIIESFPEQVELGLALIDVGWGIPISCRDWQELKPI